MAISFSRYTRTGRVYKDEQAAIWQNGTIKVLLVSTAHTFDPTAEFVDDISADEVTNDSGTGYERKTIANPTRTVVTGATVPDRAGGTTTLDIVKYDADDLTYSNINTNERIAGGYIYAEVTNDADSKLLALFDLDEDIPADVTNLPTVNINGGTNGFLYDVID